MDNASVSRNIFINGSNKYLLKILIKICVGYAKKGYNVLYIRTKPLDSLPIEIIDGVIDDLDSNYRDPFKRILFMYCNNKVCLIEKLLSIMSWEFMPKLIIIESLNDILLTSITSSSDSRIRNPNERSICWLHTSVLACLHNAINCLSMKLTEHCFSITTLDSRQYDQSFNDNTLPLLIHLYYYKNNYFDYLDVECENDDRDADKHNEKIIEHINHLNSLLDK